MLLCAYDTLMASKHVSSLWMRGREGSGQRAEELEMKTDIEYVV